MDLLFIDKSSLVAEIFNYDLSAAARYGAVDRGNPGGFTGYGDIFWLTVLFAADCQRFFGDWISNAAIEQVGRSGLRGLFCRNMMAIGLLLTLPGPTGEKRYPFVVVLSCQLVPEKGRTHGSRAAIQIYNLSVFYGSQHCLAAGQAGESMR